MEKRQLTTSVLDDSILPAYNESVMSSYNSEPVRNLLKGFDSVNKELAGSSPFMLIHLQESGLLGNKRLATRADLENALHLGLPLKGNYVDFGIALKKEEFSLVINHTFARNLISQLKSRGISLGKGRLIPFSDLNLKEDSDYGLALTLKDDVVAESMPKLVGLKWDYAAKGGIARAFLDSDGSWYAAGHEFLPGSDNGGRVVVVGVEGTSQNSLEQTVQSTDEPKKVN